MPSLVLRGHIRTILWFMAISASIGAVYGHINAVTEGAPLLGLDGVARGILTGALIAGGLAPLQLYAASAPEGAPLRRASFVVHVAITTLIDLAVIVCALEAGVWAFPGGLGVSREDVLFSLGVAFLFAFMTDINSMLGQNVLLNFITGRYYRPRMETRVFLFLDMEGSTGFAERLGPLAFHSLLNRFVGDLTEPIVAAGGEIHRYVGDEVIATWPIARGVAGANCVAACFAAMDRLARLAPQYVEEFGAGARVRAGLHCGPVVTGEMGTVKKEIVFLGDTVNTAARIQDLCRQTGDRVLASAELIDRLDLPPGIAKRGLGDLRLRGKEQDVALYALSKA